MDVSKMKAFSYSGNDQIGDPQALLEDARDGLWAAVHMVEACEVFEPTPMALKGLGNLLHGLAETLESADRIVQERLSDPYVAGCAAGARLRGRVPPEAIRELLERYRERDAAAE